jgi:hypothetical protein
MLFPLISKVLAIIFIAATKEASRRSGEEG